MLQGSKWRLAIGDCRLGVVNADRRLGELAIADWRLDELARLPIADWSSALASRQSLLGTHDSALTTRHS